MIIFLLIPAMIIIATLHATPFELSNTSTWHEYNLGTTDVPLSYDKWTWTQSFTIKTKEPIILKNLKLKWRGEKIPNLCAALYQKKATEENLMPLQQNVIADGSWNPLKQELSFAVNQKVAAVNSYHLVVSYPKQRGAIIKNGSFHVAQAETTQQRKKMKLKKRSPQLVTKRSKKH